MDKVVAPLHSLGLLELTERWMAGSDHASFEEAGVPGFFCVQEPAQYFETHHSQADTFDQAHEADLVEGAQVMAAWAYNVAQLPDLLPRKPAAASGGHCGKLSSILAGPSEREFMRAVLQRVTRARVLVDGNVSGEIGPGLVVLIAVGRDDVAPTAAVDGRENRESANLQRRTRKDESARCLISEARFSLYRSSLCTAMLADNADRVSFKLRRRNWARHFTMSLLWHCARWVSALKPACFRRICHSNSPTMVP